MVRKGPLGGPRLPYQQRKEAVGTNGRVSRLTKGLPGEEHKVLAESNNQLTTESPLTVTHRTTPNTDTFSGLKAGVLLQFTLLELIETDLI